jgi:hypothetical protein
MALDVQKPLGRRLRVRVDMYKKHPKRRFDPVRRQSVVLTVADRSEHRAMFRGLVAYLKNESWKTDVRPEDAKDDEE